MRMRKQKRAAKPIPYAKDKSPHAGATSASTAEDLFAKAILATYEQPCSSTDLTEQSRLTTPAAPASHPNA